MERPVFGRPSAASNAPWKLRSSAVVGDAAVRADGGDLGPLALRAACLAGVRHRLAATGPEDAYAWCHDGGVVHLAVADGLGSRPGAAAASATAVAAAVAALAAGAAPGEAVAQANAALAGHEGATTLVVATVTGEGRAALARVGDSTAWVLSGGAWVELWADPDGEEASNVTAALPAGAPALEAAEVDLGPGDALVVTTDGVGDALRDGPTTVAPGLAGALASPVEPLELARLTDFSRQGVGDDRTLLAVWWSAEPG